VPAGPAAARSHRSGLRAAVGAAHTTALLNLPNRLADNVGMVRQEKVPDAESESPPPNIKRTVTVHVFRDRASRQGLPVRHARRTPDASRHDTDKFNPGHWRKRLGLMALLAWVFVTLPLRAHATEAELQPRSKRLAGTGAAPRPRTRPGRGDSRRP